MAFTFIVAVLLVIIASVYFWIQKKYSFLKENGYLYETPVFPFGNLKGVGREFHIVHKITELYKKFKGRAPAFGVYFFTSPDVVITDLEIVKDVLVRDFDAFHNRGIYNNERDDPLTCHLFTLEDTKWRNMRVKLTPTFTSGKMKMMFNTLVEISDLMIKQLNDQNLNMIEVKDILSNFTTDVIGNVAFGLDVNSIKDPDSMFRRMGRKIFVQDLNFQIKIFLLTSFRSLARKLRMTLLPRDVAEFFYNATKDTVAYRRKNNIERNDMVNLLLKIKNQDDEANGLTINEIAAQCFLFFVAG